MPFYEDDLTDCFYRIYLSLLIAIFHTKWSNLYNILPNLNMNDSTPLKLQLCHVSPLQLNNNKGLRS